MSLGQTLLHPDLPTASFIPQLGCSRDITGRRIRGYTLTPLLGAVCRGSTALLHAYCARSAPVLRTSRYCPYEGSFRSSAVRLPDVLAYNAR
eukprot:4413891-Heterocapsa_arctica.AAC.1